MNRATAFFGAVLILFTTLAQAGALRTEQSVAEIVAQQQKIQAEAKKGDRGWDAIPMAERTELFSKQERLFALLENKEIIGDLNENDQVEVANTLEWINALANNAEGERKVCGRERKTGSNRMTTVCRTAKSIRRDREMAQDAIRRRPMAPKSAGGTQL